MDLSQEILKALQKKPGQKVRELAQRVGVDRSTVQSILYGDLRGMVYQDDQYRWWPRDGAVKEEPDERTKATNTILNKLCQYYLDCLNQDDQYGVSVYASNKYGDLDYVELNEMPVLTGKQHKFFDWDDKASKLWEKTRRNKGLTVILGYPVYLKKIYYKSGGEGFVVEPLFLFYFNEDPLKSRTKLFVVV